MKPLPKKLAARYYRRHEAKAMAEGWIVCTKVEVGSSHLEIMKFDEDPATTFESDVEAIEHVLRYASINKLCRCAVKLVYHI
jgi:hypothetical protein